MRKANYNLLALKRESSIYKGTNKNEGKNDNEIKGRICQSDNKK